MWEKLFVQCPSKKLNDIGLETEIVVVDNASTDNTSKEASEAGARVVLETNRGYGNAYLRGFKEATGDIMVMGDADGTYPFDEMVEFIQPILKGDAEFVMGSRLKGDIRPGAMPALHKYIGNPFLTWVLNVLFHTGISDAHCGMRAMTKEAWGKLNLKTNGMEFASEMVIEASRQKLRIAEIPITYYPREGESKLSSFSDGWRHLRFMMLYRPGPFLLIPGVIALIFGAALTLLVWIQGISRMHSLILGGILVLTGYQLLLSWFYFGAFGATYGYSSSSGIKKKIDELPFIREGTAFRCHLSGWRDNTWTLRYFQLEHRRFWCTIPGANHSGGHDPLTVRYPDHFFPECS
nr:glycosyltransferase family 2 protein [Methanobacterium formicicum]